MDFIFFGEYVRTCCTLYRIIEFFFQNYIYPWLYKTKMEEDSNTRLQRTLETLNSSMASLEATLSSQKVILESLVRKTEALEDYNWRAESTDIKSEIISLKGLLLSS